VVETGIPHTWKIKMSLECY